jgi:hypothetical protein
MSDGDPQEISKKSKKRAWEETQIEEKVDEDEADVAVEKPISESTKNLIYALIADPSVTDPEKYLPLIEKISTMTEDQGLAYLECLTVFKNVKVHSHLSKQALVFLCRLVCHPNDIVTQEIISNDQAVIDGIAFVIGKAVSMFGRLAPFVLLTLYGGASWASHYQFKKASPKPTVSDDNLREKPNGENNNFC